MSVIEEHPNAWWWHPDVDPQTLGTMLTNNQGRLISLSPFLANGQLRLAAVWVSNTGNQHKAWWWHPDVDAPTLRSMLDDNKGRLVSLSPYVVNDQLRLAAVWISNTGADSQDWWWHPDVDPRTLGTMLANNQGRLVCLNTYTIRNSRRYSAVWVSNTGPHTKAWWWHPDVDGETLGNMLKNDLGRLVSLDPFVVNGITCYAAVWVQNADQQSRAWWWEMLVSQSGGWMDYKIPLYGSTGLFQGKSQELASGQSRATSRDIGSGLSPAYCIICEAAD
jgi:hypothetical protein